MKDTDLTGQNFMGENPFPWALALLFHQKKKKLYASTDNVSKLNSYLYRKFFLNKTKVSDLFKFFLIILKSNTIFSFHP